MRTVNRIASPLNLCSNGSHVWQQRRSLSTPGLSNSRLDNTIKLSPDQRLESPFSQTTYNFLIQCELQNKKGVSVWVYINQTRLSPLLTLNKFIQTLSVSCLLVNKTITHNLSVCYCRVSDVYFHS